MLEINKYNLDKIMSMYDMSGGVCYEEIPAEEVLELLKQDDKNIRNIKSTEV